MPLVITRFPAGPIETNAYLVADEATGDAIVIDAPPDSTGTLTAAIAQQGVTVRAVVITHGHWDHIVDTAPLAQALGVPVYAHAGAAERIATPGAELPVPMTPGTVDNELDEGDVVTVGAYSFTVFYLPGHDEAHIALYSEADRVFLGGDVLFPGGHGRTDIPGSDQATMIRTIGRLLALPDDVVVYPGHGETTTIGRERPWMTQMAANA